MDGDGGDDWSLRDIFLFVKLLANDGGVSDVDGGVDRLNNLNRSNNDLGWSGLLAFLFGDGFEGILRLLEASDEPEVGNEEDRHDQLGEHAASFVTMVVFSMMLSMLFEWWW